MDDFPRLNTVTLCPAATASRTDVSDIWPLPPTNSTLNATDLLLLVSFVLESRRTRVHSLIKIELARVGTWAQRAVLRRGILHCARECRAIIAFGSASSCL